MTSTFRRIPPADSNGENHPRRIETHNQQMQAINKLLSNVANSNQTLRRHVLISQEHLSQDNKASQMMLSKKLDDAAEQRDEISEQISEGHKQMATKEDLTRLEEQLADSQEMSLYASNQLLQKMSEIADLLRAGS